MTELPENLDWKTVYDTTPVDQLPWYYPNLDEDIGEFLNAEVPPGSSVLDLGTGPGTQAVELVKRGYVVTGTDISEGAIREARLLAGREGVRATFLVDNILECGLPIASDAVVDRGCFHVLPPDKRRVYIQQLAKLVRTRGWFVLKVFSPAETRPGGPHRIAEEELRKLFSPAFERIKVSNTVYQGTVSPDPKALLLTGIRKKN